jgi:hypothetical protein
VHGIEAAGTQVGVPAPGPAPGCVPTPPAPGGTPPATLAAAPAVPGHQAAILSVIVTLIPCLPLSAVFIKLDGLTRFLAWLLPAPHLGQLDEPMQGFGGLAEFGSGAGESGGGGGRLRRG